MNRRPAVAQTAFGPMVIAACEQYTPLAQRVVDDALAARFLPPGQRLLLRACRWPAARRLLVEATERMATGMWAAMLCRKRYADDEVTSALAAGIGQLVVLGAGLDTRAYRLAVPARARAFEVDLPANTTYKRRRVPAVLGAQPDLVSLVPMDFESSDLAAELASSGFVGDQPAVFVWEAVTQYLTQDAVHRTLAVLSTAAAGSRLLFTYVRQDFLDGTHLYDAPHLHQRMTGRYRVWRFGLAPDEVGSLLQRYGWTEREQVGGAEYRTRYLEPTRRPLPVSEIERCVLAEKT